MRFPAPKLLILKFFGEPLLAIVPPVFVFEPPVPPESGEYPRSLALGIVPSDLANMILPFVLLKHISDELGELFVKGMPML